jgi:hypothetical protein
MDLPKEPRSGEIGTDRAKSGELAHQTAHPPRKEFHREGQSESAKRDKARARFLDAYAAEVPEILNDLLDIEPPYPADPSFEVTPWVAVPYRFPDLANALSGWAKQYYLVSGDKPADWAMQTGIETLSMARSRARMKLTCGGWHHPLQMRQTIPVPDPEFLGVWTGESEVQAFGSAFSFWVEIAPWNRVGGETKQDFRKRAKSEWNRALEEHISQMQEWSGRVELAEERYLDGLAWWQAGRGLAEIKRRFATAKPPLNVGSESDLTPIWKGLTRAAAFIGIDRRPGARHHKVNGNQIPEIQE